MHSSNSAPGLFECDSPALASADICTCQPNVANATVTPRFQTGRRNSGRLPCRVEEVSRLQKSFATQGSVSARISDAGRISAIQAPRHGVDPELPVSRRNSNHLSERLRSGYQQDRCGLSSRRPPRRSRAERRQLVLEFRRQLHRIWRRDESDCTIGACQLHLSTTRRFRQSRSRSSACTSTCSRKILRAAFAARSCRDSLCAAVCSSF